MALIFLIRGRSGDMLPRHDFAIVTKQYFSLKKIRLFYSIGGGLSFFKDIEVTAKNTPLPRKCDIFREGLLTHLARSLEGSDNAIPLSAMSP